MFLKPCIFLGKFLYSNDAIFNHNIVFEYTSIPYYTTYAKTNLYFKIWHRFYGKIYNVHTYNANGTLGVDILTNTILNINYKWTSNFKSQNHMQVPFYLLMIFFMKSSNSVESFFKVTNSHECKVSFIS